MELSDISVFVKVVQTGSFGKAAMALSLSKSTVSTKITQLESRLGVPLLQRTTRKLHTTSIGQAFYVQCAKALEILATAESQVSEDQSQAKGLLRITVPAGLADSLLPKILQTFERANPNVEVDVFVTDRFVDLVGEGFDLAIRGGHLKDSSLIAKKIGLTEFGLYAGPSYLKKNAMPVHPKDLIAHESLCMVFLNINQISKGKEIFHLPSYGRIKANNLALAKRLALMGVGISLLDTLNSAEEVSSGKLVRVLPEWRAQSHPLYIVYPAHKFVSPKLRAFIDITAKILGSYL